MGKYANRNIPNIIRRIKTNTNDVGHEFKSIDYDGFLKFLNNEFVFYIGDKAVLTIGAGGLDVDTLPPQEGQAGKYLYTDGSDASWQPIGSGSGGTVTEVRAGAGMDFTDFTLDGTVTLGTPSTITSSTTNNTTTDSHTHRLNDTGVIASSYSPVSSITVDSKGRVLDVQSLTSDTGERYGSESLSTGTNLIIFSSSVSSIPYTLVARCYDANGNNIGHRIYNKTVNGFNIDVGEDSTVDYIVRS